MLKQPRLKPALRLMTLEDACQVIAYSLKTLRRHIQENALVVIRAGWIIRIHSDDMQHATLHRATEIWVTAVAAYDQ